MSGIIAVYGLVVSVLIAGSSPCCSPLQLVDLIFFFSVNPHADYPLFSGFVHLGAGLACGLTGISAGYAIGFVGDSVSIATSIDSAICLIQHCLANKCVRAYVYESKVFVSMVLILIFAEVLGLYGYVSLN
jgi:V-type H+-transporting ATPase 16kDa proteolipid subunit